MPEDRPARIRQRKLLRFFEYPLALGLILVLITLILQRVDDLHGKAERLAVQGMIRSMQGAVLMQTGQGKEAPGEGLGPGSNPMRLMQDLPESYLGELKDVPPHDVKGGHWYFDRESRTLIYRINNAAGFESELKGPPRIRLSLEAAQKMQKARKRILSCGPTLCLMLEEQYSWGQEKRR